MTLPERQSWFSGPVDGVVFALIMAVAAFVGRENPRFIYPHILFSFLGLLVFNFLNFSTLPRLCSEARRAILAVTCNVFLLSLVVHFSGGPQSYFWVLYLLPVFNACLAFGKRGVLATTGAVVALLLVFHADVWVARRWVELLELLIKTAIISASAFVVTRVAEQEREARRRLTQEERRSERDRSQAREQIQSMDRLATLGTLTAGVAHELNTPLATILGYAQMLLNPRLPPHDSKRFASRIQDSARRCRRIIQDMLAFSRQKKSRRRLCNVNALLRECAQLKEHDWAQDGVRLEFDLAANLPHTLLSGAEFQQVIFNLLTNAHQAIRDAGRKDGRIRLHSRHEAGWLLVTVEDNGPGVPAQTATQIWEPFFTTKPECEGTGLGLAICRQIVEAQGGTIILKPAAASGASFLIRLPVATEAAPAAKTHAARCRPRAAPLPAEPAGILAGKP